MPSRESRAIDRLGHELAKVFNDGDVEDAKETIRRCLTATRSMRVGRDAGGHLIYEEVPDYPIQLAAGVKIIEWAVGKPINRSVHAELKAPGSDNTQERLVEELMRDPEARKTVRETFDKMLEAAEKAKPVDVTVTPAVPEGQQPSS